MGRRTLFMHAGLPKTGTSSLQRWLATNPAGLQCAGLDYPPVFPPGEFKQQVLVSDLCNNTLSRAIEILTPGCSRNRIISSEGLSNHLEDFHPNALKSFQHLSRHYGRVVLLVTRTQHDWSKSFYKQALINPGNGVHPLWATDLTFRDFCDHPRVQTLTDSDRLVQRLGEAFHADVVTFSYHLGTAGEILSWLGVEGFNAADLPNENKSIPDWLCEPLRRLNAYQRNSPGRNECIAWLRERSTLERPASPQAIGLEFREWRIHHPINLPESCLDSIQAALDSGESI